MKTQFFQGPMLVFTGPLGLQMIAIKRCYSETFRIVKNALRSIPWSMVLINLDGS